MKNAFKPRNLAVTVVESAIAAGAAAVAVLTEVPIWAMFVGWIGFFTRGLDLRNALVNFGCVVAGLVLGVAAASVLASLGGPPGVIEFAATVFVVAVLVLSLRFLPVFNNLLGFFLGLVAWFAYHQPVSLSALGTLVFAAALGAAAGLFAHAVQKRIAAAAAPH